MNSAKKVDQMIADWRKAGLSKSEIVIRVAEAMMEWPYVWGAVGRDCTVANRKAYINGKNIGDGDKELIRKRCQVLNESASGCAGCKYYPGGEVTRIHDCQGFVKKAFEAADIVLKGGGCTTMYGNNANWSAKGKISDMPDVVCCVFTHVDSTGKMDHIGIHVGGGRIIHCSVEVKEGSVGEKRRVPWSHYAIPIGINGDAPVVSRPIIRRGSTGVYVRECQEYLIRLGYDLGNYGSDGKFGAKTEAAARAFQGAHDLKVDGAVGPATWAALDKAIAGLDPTPEPAPAPAKTYTVTVSGLEKAEAERLAAEYPGKSEIREDA